MTRFWLSLEAGVRFVIECIENMQGGEVFVPKIPSMKVVDLARAIAPDAALDIVGIRPGEKLHEVLISQDEARNTVESQRMYVVKPPETLWERSLNYEGTPLADGFQYSSDTNEMWLDLAGIKKLVEPFDRLYAAGRLEA
jgi:UDP-N-acetylglucosamine 4,6-dehydratase